MMMMMPIPLLILLLTTTPFFRYADPRFDRRFDEATGFRTRSILATPILVDGRVAAVLATRSTSARRVGDEA